LNVYTPVFRFDCPKKQYTPIIAFFPVKLKGDQNTAFSDISPPARHRHKNSIKFLCLLLTETPKTELFTNFYFVHVSPQTAEKQFSSKQVAGQKTVLRPRTGFDIFLHYIHQIWKKPLYKLIFLP